jgi:hypothetical protein
MESVAIGGYLTGWVGQIIQDNMFRLANLSFSVRGCYGLLSKLQNIEAASVARFQFEVFNGAFVPGLCLKMSVVAI